MLVTALRMREGLKWKARSHEVRVARTWNEKPDPKGHAPNYKLHLNRHVFLITVVRLTWAKAHWEWVSDFNPRLKPWVIESKLVLGFSLSNYFLVGQ